MEYRILFAPEVHGHLDALTAQQRSTVLDAIGVHLRHEPTVETRNRKPMDPDRRAFIAPWELRVQNLRVYYAVKDGPEPMVVIVAVGVKVRNQIRIGGKDVGP